MRILITALFVAAAVDVGAQIVGPEQSYGPYVPPAVGEEPALAVGRQGVLLAWSEIQSGQASIHLAMLDHNARLVSAINSLPATGAVGPAVATDGTAFFLAYLKDGKTWGLPIDSSGQAIGSPRPYGSTLVAWKPPMVWDGASYVLWTVNEVFAIAPDGSIRFRADTDPPEAVTADDGIAFAWWTKRRELNYEHCFPRSLCVPKVTEAYDLGWVRGAAGGTHATEETRVSAPAIASGDGTLVVSWAAMHHVSYVVIDRGSFETAAEADMSTSPGLACSGGQCLIAYGTRSGDIHALSFPADHFTLVDLVPIATSERQESKPRVHAIGPGRFLVTYLSRNVDADSFAGRLVTLETSKRRSVR